MNASDKKNPRRLLRAIEVATWKIGNVKKEQKIEKKKVGLDVLIIGLTASEDVINKKIETRVIQRINDGIKKEIKSLLENQVNWNMPSMSSIGYRQWKSYFDGQETESGVIRKWEDEEKRYVKRQMVWFKKDKRIHWFDITDLNYPENVEKSVERWYKEKRL